MTMLTWFDPAARQAVIRAGLLAGEHARPLLGDDLLLLALAEGPSLAAPLDLSVSAASVRAHVQGAVPPPGDRELLATLGIDLDEVRQRAAGATGLRRDDPALWRLHRSRTRPLRVTLSGPAAQIVLAESGRKVVEVARWASRRGHRAQISREDLLWGLLADGSSASVRILRRHQVDIARLWAGLQTWHQTAS
jgi:Clp amino terminal domain, pathogenicity island component